MASPLHAHDPRRVGRYALEARLGAGGQGVVFLGRDPSGGPVAVKMLQIDEAAARSRFVRELETAKQVSRFCTAQVLDADVSGDRLYIVSEFVEGPTLAALVRDGGPLRGADLDRLAIGTATALAAVHAAGIVHRDFKPANVIMSPSGPRVIDFGVARVLDAAAETVSQVVGTPAYMAPEQVSGEPISQAADVFAWGATMLYAATGRAPFAADTIPAIFNRILHHEPDPGPLGGVLRELVAGSLAKDPAPRPGAEEILLRLMREGAAGPIAEGPAGDGVPDETVRDTVTLLAEGTTRASTAPPPGPGPAMRPTPPQEYAPPHPGPPPGSHPGPQPGPQPSPQPSPHLGSQPGPPPWSTPPQQPVRPPWPTPTHPGPARRGSRRLLIPLGAALAVAALAVALVAYSVREREGGGAPGAFDAGAGSSGATSTAARVAAPERIRAAGTLTIATDPTYRPMSFTGTDGITGFDVELAREIAKRFGVRPRVVNTTFDSILTHVQDGRADLGVSGITDLRGRERVSDFVTYLRIGTSLLVPAGNPGRLKPDDRSLCGRTVAVVAGTVQAESLGGSGAHRARCEEADMPVPRALERTALPTVQQALTSGAADAALVDSAMAGYLVKERPGAFAVAGPLADPQPQGIAVRKGDRELATAVREALRHMIADGAYARLADRWGLTAGKITDPRINGATD
ncbi:bifunctional serine/threonine-protein kinase/transporter substrate-binding domain-containing protein [Actinomadura sp. NPDC047616]|uniref:bifunctional serine/threonine-protein kinase/transporter substrate-binding domain-containing protein n=1 Tax=Actinomadura sp. NPDC047616 TaxID=3155914 RepID=UPI0033E5C181